MPVSSHPPKLHVLVVDDSAMVRQVMESILGSDERIEVSVAADPLIALRKIQQRLPDVVVTDLEMPRMDGLSFLRKIMEEFPLPVVICSGFAARGTEMALRALEEGAIEIISKPKLGVREFLNDSAVILLDAVWSAAQARALPRRRASLPKQSAADVASVPGSRHIQDSPLQLIAVGASTGGTEALRTFLSTMPQDCPPIAIVQHMPEVFTRAFAERLDKECLIKVKEARDGETLRQGEALIAPGNLHTLVERGGSGLKVKVVPGGLVSRHRPSVDVLFRSVAIAAGPSAIGIILTGMGDDGAQGLLEMKTAGAVTIAQDETSSVVFGMPREAIAKGAVDLVLALEKIGPCVLNLITRSRDCTQTDPTNRARLRDSQLRRGA
ncbi:MAG TPA: chemotaxis response regulator protein-glutamate methylesterase [Terriglobales bacterium]|nr:chemotaxis response regulator protein-glutamate methylesterase [Terriglobales bacterium]